MTDTLYNPIKQIMEHYSQKEIGEAKFYIQSDKNIISTMDDCSDVPDEDWEIDCESTKSKHIFYLIWSTTSITTRTWAWTYLLV